MRFRHYSIPTAIALAGTVLLSGCASAARTADVGPAPTSTPQAADRTPNATSVRAVSSVGVATPSMIVIAPARTVSAGSRPPMVSSHPAPTLTRSTVTAADNGAVVAVHPGEQITVILSGSWDPLLIGDARVLHLVSMSGAYPSTTTAALHATITATGSGQAEVTTSTDMGCLHSTPRCLPAQQLWRIQVVVR